MSQEKLQEGAIEPSLYLDPDSLTVSLLHIQLYFVKNEPVQRTDGWITFYCSPLSKARRITGPPYPPFPGSSGGEKS